MISLQRHLSSAQLVAKLPSGQLRRHAAGRAVMEFVLVAVVPLFCWFAWYSFSKDVSALWQAGGKAISHGPLKTVRDLIDLKNGQLIALHRDGELRFWNTSTEREAGEILCQIDEARCGALAEERRLIAIGDSKGNLRIFNVDNPESAPREIKVNHVAICDCTFTRDESMLIVAGGDGDLTLWEPESGKLLHKFQADESAVHTLLLSQDEQTLYGGMYSGMVYAWDLKSRTLKYKFKTTESASPDTLVIGLFEGPEAGQLVVTNRDGQVSFWSADQGTLLKKFAVETPYLISAALSDDRTSLVAISERGDTRVWNLRSGISVEKQMFQIGAVRVVAMAGNSNRVVGGDNLGGLAFVDLGSPVN